MSNLDLTEGKVAGILPLTGYHYGNKGDFEGVDVSIETAAQIVGVALLITDYLLGRRIKELEAEESRLRSRLASASVKR